MTAIGVPRKKPMSAEMLSTQKLNFGSTLTAHQVIKGQESTMRSLKIEFKLPAMCSLSLGK